MKRLKTKAPEGLSRQSLWFKPMRPFFDAVAFQARIDLRVPRNKDNKAVIRLAWAQDLEDTAFGETTPRYWTKRRKVAKDVDSSGWQYYTVPRWVLEKRLEPEQYVDSWEKARWSMQDARGVPIDRGPAPAEYYTFAHLIADHEAVDGSGWAACCNRAFYTDRSRCWGKYRQPGELELQLVSQAMRQMEADKYRDPYRPLTPTELAELQTMAGMQVEREAEQEANLAREQAADFYGLPVSAIPENYGRRESGLIAPN